MKINWLDRSLITSPCYLALCTNKKLFRKAMRHLGIPEKDHPPFLANWHSNATVHFFELREEGKMCAVVCLGDFKGHDQVTIFGLLTHEAVHVWQEIRKLLGEKTPSDEFEAYAIQNLSQQLHDEFLRQTK